MNDKIINIEEKMSHTVSEVICVKCGNRWISVRPNTVLLKNLECKDCGIGFVIETGQSLENVDYYNSLGKET